MSHKRKPDLSAALAEAGGSTRRRQAVPLRAARAASGSEQRAESEKDAELGSTPYVSPSRIGLVAVTAHFPKQVRDQLKILAIEQGGTLHGLMAEALNDLFAKYGRPEIAPHQSMGV